MIERAVFLASSEELKIDRETFGGRFARLTDTYVDKGIRLRLHKWERESSTMALPSMQEQYNNRIRASDIGLFLFHTIAGNYTLEEFAVAQEAQRDNGKPSIAIYAKDCPAGISRTPELEAFLADLDREHIAWTPYTSIENVFRNIATLIDQSLLT